MDKINHFCKFKEEKTYLLLSFAYNLTFNKEDNSYKVQSEP